MSFANLPNTYYFHRSMIDNMIRVEIILAKITNYVLSASGNVEL